MYLSTRHRTRKIKRGNLTKENAIKRQDKATQFNSSEDNINNHPDPTTLKSRPSSDSIVFTFNILPDVRSEAEFSLPREVRKGKW